MNIESVLWTPPVVLSTITELKGLEITSSFPFMGEIAFNGRITNPP